MKEVNFCQYLPPKRRVRCRERKKDEQPQQSNLERKSSAFLCTPSPNTVKVVNKKGNNRNACAYSYSSNSSNEKSFEQKVSMKDYNIFHIDSKIRTKILSKIDTVDRLKKELEKIIWIMNYSKDPVDKVLARSQASLLRSSIQDLENAFELMLYTLRTEDILRDYRELLSTNDSRNFVTIGTSNKNNTLSKSAELIARYLCIAQEYIEIENLQYNMEKLKCPACQCLDFKLDDDNSTYICNNCYTEIDILDDTPSFKDTDRVNMSSRYTYTKRGHFIDAMKRFQGTQNTDPQKIKNVVDVLLEEMDKHNLKKSSDNRKEKVTKDHLYMFLCENKLSGYYDDINLLYHIITGEPCPNISEYEDTLLELFEKQEEAYRKIQDPERINSLNVNYKLYKLLQKVGYSCKKDDFYILKTKNKEDEHDEILRKAWEILDWPWLIT